MMFGIDLPTNKKLNTETQKHGEDVKNEQVNSVSLCLRVQLFTYIVYKSKSNIQTENRTNS